MYQPRSNAYAPTHSFTADGLATASNARILVMCFDRLDRDMTVALAALERADHYATNEALGHAQDLLGEVAAMLEVDAWEHASSLLAIYDYVLRLLAKANLLKSDALVVEAQRLIGEIGDAFRSAAVGAGTPATVASPEGDVSSSGLSIRA